MPTKAQHVDLLALAGQHTELKWAANTGGGEWSGPCPFCGGNDRFRVQPQHQTGPRWFCRHCGDNRWHDAIDFIRRLRNVGYREALRLLEISPSRAGSETAAPSRAASHTSTPTQRREPPSEDWRKAAVSFLRECRAALWDERGTQVLQWLTQRGLSPATIQGAGLGYNPATRHAPTELWGIQEGRNSVWLPQGVVIPGWVGSKLWSVAIRQLVGEPKYVNVTGSQPQLYNGDELHTPRATILVEGVMDALSIQQVASDLVIPVASGTTAARNGYWVSRLARQPLVLVSFDADEPGDKAAAWWLQRLSNGRRWRPFWSDANAMAQAGVDVRAWIQVALTTFARPFIWPS